MNENEELKTPENNESKTENEKQKKESNTPNNPNQNRKIILNVVTAVVSLLLLILILSVSQNNGNQVSVAQKSFSDLVSLIRQQKVSKIELSEDKQKLFVDVYKNLEKKDRKDVETQVFPNISNDKQASVLENLNNSLGDSKLQIGSEDGKIIYAERVKPWYVGLVSSDNFWLILSVLITVGLGVFFIRKITESNNRAISFGNSKAKSYEELDGKDKVTFKDVAGNEEAKQELTEVVDFLKRADEYQKMGARIPRGVMLVGSPGNGKTLMAKAVAGEADVPFLYVSGSEFVEMFVGVGAGRVRDLFKRAKKKAPCVIFIDEIDAVGRQRGAGLGGGNDEREQTLNQILVEMDGFEPNTSVIVIAATNRPDVLDPALLRPGRFDRQVTVTAPDRKEREDILKVHARNKKLAEDVDLTIIAKRTAGFSGADLMNVLNEAAILAVRGNQTEVNNEILREAIEKVILGPSLKSKVITDTQKKLTAYHEAGHALISTVLPKAEKVQKITIIPRGRAAGYTFHAENENDAITKTITEFLSTITVLFGGYVTEEIVFGEVSTGGSNDLAKATEIARNMATKYGMSSLGPVSFAEDKGMSFLGRDMMQKQQYSEEMAKQIDLVVSSILNKCYLECKEIIKTYRKNLDEIATVLIEKEVLEYEDFNEIIAEIKDKWTNKLG